MRAAVVALGDLGRSARMRYHAQALASNGVDGLLALAQKKEIVTNAFRIGLYPFITDIDSSYAPLTSSINGSSTTVGTINYAAANLATELDTNMNSTLGSGGTHIDNALHSLNALIANVGTGSSSTNTQPYVFLVTDGAQDNQYKDVPNGNWHGSNHATVINDSQANTYPTICNTLKNRGIIVSVLYIPYQTINPVNTSFAGDEDDYANNNIVNIPPSLRGCASPGFFYTANTPSDITAALNAMFNQALATMLYQEQRFGMLGCDQTPVAASCTNPGGIDGNTTGDALLPTGPAHGATPTADLGTKNGDAAVVEKESEEGAVLLKNDSSALPITRSDLSGGVLVTGPGARFLIKSTSFLPICPFPGDTNLLIFDGHIE